MCLLKDTCKDISTIGKHEANLVDKGGTPFDPLNPDTWTEAMREADRKIA